MKGMGGAISIERQERPHRGSDIRGETPHKEVTEGVSHADPSEIGWLPDKGAVTPRAQATWQLLNAQEVEAAHAE